jgi:hypothetical protein
MKSPDSSSYFDDFVERHSLRSNSAIEAEFKGIHWASAANVLINQGYACCTEDDFWQKPAIGLILNLLHRAFEQVDAALVAFTTGSGAASEAVSRVTAELSISILYILGGQAESRLLAFFDNYTQQENKRLRNWMETAQTLPEGSKQEHIRAIEHRRTGVAAILDVMARLRNEFVRAGVPYAVETWPNVAARFEATGHASTYRTVYSRMSGQVHSDAEETIRYFIARGANNAELFERMALETVLFSRLLLYLAVSYFLEASAAYSKVYSMKNEFAFLGRGRVVVDEELEMIVRDLGELESGVSHKQ